MLFCTMVCGEGTGISPHLNFFKPVIPSVLAYAVLILIGFCVVSIVPIPASLLFILLISFGISLIYFILVTRVILTNPERDLIRSIIPTVFQRCFQDGLL